MRRLLQFAIGLIVLAGTVAMTTPAAGPACACSCAPVSADRAVETADVIVYGSAVSESVEGQTRTVVFEVDHSYKQRVPRMIEVQTASSSAACGLSVQLHRPRLLVLGRSAEGMQASMCLNMSLHDDAMPASAGRQLPPLSYPDMPDVVDADDDADQALTRSWWVVTLWALAGVVIVAGGVVLLARRNR